MKNITKLIPFVLMLFIISCADKKAANKEEIAADAFTAVDVEVYKKLITRNGVLVDVRTPVEFAEGKIEGASNIDWMGDDFENKIQELDKEKPVYVYCTAGGKRSIDSMQKMKDLGFTEVYNLKGGYLAWMEQQ